MALKPLWCHYIKHKKYWERIVYFFRHKWEFLVALFSIGLILALLSLLAFLVYYTTTTPYPEKIGIQLNTSPFVLNKYGKCYEVTKFYKGYITTPCKCQGKGDYTFQYEGWCYKVTETTDGYAKVEKVGCM